MKKILVLEDEANIRSFVVINLRRSGYEPIEAETGAEALEKWRVNPDICLALLDVMLPDIDGFEVCRRIRASGSKIGIIMLTAKSQEIDKVTGLMTGADDYVTKPFAFDTVLARIRAVLKRTQPQKEGTREFGTLHIDMDNARVSLGGQTVELTKREYLILCLLAQHPNSYLSREEIMTQVWPDNTLVNDRGVDVHITRLRKKLGNEAWRVANKTGFGYVLKN